MSFTTSLSTSFGMTKHLFNSDELRNYQLQKQQQLQKITDPYSIPTITNRIFEKRIKLLRNLTKIKSSNTR